MSLESKIEALTAAVNNLSAVLASRPSGQPAVAPSNVLPFPTPAPQPLPTPAPAPVAAMPPPPMFAAPVAAPAPAAPQQSGVPFADVKGLIAYVMDTYKAMGPQKGARIQEVLQGCGCANINDLPADKFGQFYAGVEALKAA